MAWWFGIFNPVLIMDHFWSLALWASNWGIAASFFFYFRGSFADHVSAPKVVAVLPILNGAALS